jgi:hypothetical protein
MGVHNRSSTRGSIIRRDTPHDDKPADRSQTNPKFRQAPIATQIRGLSVFNFIGSFWDMSLINELVHALTRHHQ